MHAHSYTHAHVYKQCIEFHSNSIFHSVVRNLFCWQCVTTSDTLHIFRALSLFFRSIERRFDVHPNFIRTTLSFILNSKQVNCCAFCLCVQCTHCIGNSGIFRAFHGVQIIRLVLLLLPIMLVHSKTDVGYFTIPS